MSWLIIILSGCMEIGVVYNVKKSEGFTKLKYTLLCFMFIFFSVSPAVRGSQGHTHQRRICGMDGNWLRGKCPDGDVVSSRSLKT